jgi:Trk-type K+ transport system membrane component
MTCSDITGNLCFPAVLQLYDRIRLLQALSDLRLMVWALFVVFVLLWLLALIGHYTMGGFIHILLVVAVVMAIVKLISDRLGTR